ncbi:porin [Kaistia soli]|nr:porin [Kaistia soli]
MNFKHLLLGSAAVIFACGAAEAADLTVAEPVDYVKVCDAFGKGFFYSPGTDTCIKVGGYVKFGTAFGDTDFGTYNKIYPNSQWSNFYTEASVQLTASSVTEFGNLTGFLDFRAQSGNTGSFTQSATQTVNAATNSAYVDSAYLALGPIKAGRFDSLYDFGQGYTDTGGFASDTKTDHIQLTYAVNGFGLAISVEDQRDRGASGNTGDPVLSGASYYQGGQTNIPDIVGALTYASGIFSTKIAVAYVNDAVDINGGAGTLANPYVIDAKSGYAIGGSVEFALDSFSKGDKFFVTGSYGDNANSYTGIAGGTSVANLTSSVNSNFIASAAPGSSWSALASYKHVWTPTVWSAVSGGYASYDGDSYYDNYTVDAYRGVFSTGWTPVTGLDLMLDGQYSHVEVSDGRTAAALKETDGDAWTVNLWMKRSW